MKHLAMVADMPLGTNALTARNRRGINSLISV